MNKTLNKKLKMCLAVSALFGGTLIFPAAAEMTEAAKETEIDIYSDFVSHYVWRGMLLTDDPVWQPGATLSMYDFSFDIWTNVDLTDINRPAYDYHLSEVDYTLSYEMAVTDDLTIEAGGIYYTFPGTGADATTELYISAAYDILTQPTLTIYRDIDEIDGWYANFGIGHTFKLQEDLGLSLGASLGWGDEDYNTGYFGVNDSGLNDLGLNASLDYTINDNLSMSVFAGYSELLDSVIKDAAADSDTLFGGIGMYFTY